MTIKFNDTQLTLLSAALQRDDRYLVPPPYAKRGQAQRATAKLLEAGLIKEKNRSRRRLEFRFGGAMRKRGSFIRFKLSATGAKAIAVSEETPPEGNREQRSDNPTARVDANPETGSEQSLAPIDAGASPVASTPTAPRGGTKIGQVNRTVAAWRWRNPRRDSRRHRLAARTRRGPPSLACASAATSSGSIGPTRREDRSIGSSRRQWVTKARRRALTQRRLAKRSRIGPSARRARDPVGRRDGEARKRQRAAPARHRSRRRHRRQSAKRSTPRSRACPASTWISFVCSGETIWAGSLPPIFRDGSSCGCLPIESRPPHSGI